MATFNSPYLPEDHPDQGRPIIILDTHNTWFNGEPIPRHRAKWADTNEQVCAWPEEVTE